MPEFDPIGTEFDPDVPPIVADTHGLEYLSKLKDGKKVLDLFAGIEGSEAHPQVSEAQAKLTANLARYRDYKVARGESLFSLEPEVTARKNMMSDDKLARLAKKLTTSDENSFPSILEERGEMADYTRKSRFMRDTGAFRESYITDIILAESGYSEGEIQSGAAEPHMRKRLNAKEDGTETTFAAYKRWGLAKTNEFDRVLELEESAKSAVSAAFTGHVGPVSGFASFEKGMATKHPNTTNLERTSHRAIFNYRYAQMVKHFGGNRPLAQKIYNTAAKDDGLDMIKGIGVFKNYREATNEMSKLSEEDLNKTLFLLSEISKNHGEDVDARMSTLFGKRMKRGGVDMLEASGEANSYKNLRAGRNLARSAVKSGKVLFISDRVKPDIDTIASEFLTLNAFPGAVQSGEPGDAPPKGLYGPLTPFFAGAIRTFDKDFKTPGFRQITEEEMSGLEGAFQRIEKGISLNSTLLNWRDGVAKIKGSNPVMETAFYGTANSLPEMLGYMSGAGMRLVFNAQLGRNMRDIKQRYPDADFEDYLAPATAGAAAYTAAGLGQLITLGVAMKSTQSVARTLGKLLLLETAQETVQDLTFSQTLEVYAAMDKDLKSFQMLPEGDWELFDEGFGFSPTPQAADGEILAAIKRVPMTMLAVAPLVIAGQGGRSALEFIDGKVFEKALADEHMRHLYNIGPNHYANIQKIESIGGKLEYIKENNSEFLNGANEIEFGEIPHKAQITPQADGKFSISNGVDTLTAWSPEEAAQAVLQLDPSVGKTAELKSEKRTEAEQTELDALQIEEAASDTDQAKVSADPQTLTDAVNASVDTAVSEHVSQQPVEDQPDAKDSVGTLATDALMGDMEALKELPPEVRKAVENGIDRLDNTVVDEASTVRQARIAELESKGDTPQSVQSQVDAAALDSNMAYELASQTRSKDTAENKSVDWEMALDPKFKTSNPISHPEVTKSLVNVLETLDIKSGIRQGKKLGKNILGTYNFRNGVLRVAKHGDVTTSAHEIAHAIQDQYIYPGDVLSDASWRKDTKVSSDVMADLASVADSYYGGGKMGATLSKQGIIYSEGFAEFTRLKLQGENMATIAPVADAWFEKTILKPNAKLAKTFTKAKLAIVKYGGQGSLNRARANIVKTPTLLEKTQNNIVDFYQDIETDYVESLTPFKKIVKEVERLSGKPLKGVENPYLMGKQYRMTHSAVVKHMVEDGMLTFNRESLGYKSSLKYGLQGITKKNRMDFAIYLWAKRTLRLAPSKRDSGLSVLDANKIFNELNTPAFQRASDLVYEWNNNILQYASDSSVDFKEVVKLVRQYDPGNYISLSREFSRFDKMYKSTGSSATSANLVKKLKGSGRRIKDPFETMISNAEQMVLQSHQRKIVESLLNLTDIKDLNGNPIKIGPIITKTSGGSIPVANRNAADLINEAAKVMDGQLSEAAKELAKIVRSSDQAEALVTLWGKAYVPQNAMENPIIPIFRNGKREFYEVNREAYEALAGLEMFRMNPFLDATVGRMNRTWRAGTTSYDATFQLITNPSRDVRTLYAHTQSSAGFFKIMGKWGQTMVIGGAEALSANYKQTEWAKLSDRLGLSMATPMGQDSQYTRLVTKRLFDGKVMRLLRPSNIGDYFRDLIQFGEKATRLTELKLIAKDIKFDPKKDKMTPEILQRFMLAGSEVTTDFRASGNIGKVVNQVLPFWNAQMQGIRAHGRAYKQRVDGLKGQEGVGKIHQYAFNTFMARGYQMSIASIVLWLANKDEEWWKQMPSREKYTHTYIPVPADVSPTGLPELIKIPKAFELDGVFASLPVAALDSFYQENPDEAVGWAKQFLGSVVPTHPVLSSYLREQSGAEDFYGRTVIPPSEEVLDTDGQRYRQYGEYTTKVAMDLGKMFDMSPRRIDHTVKSFFGRAGIDALEVFGTASNDTREDHMTRFPVLGSIFHPRGQSPYSPKSITEFYEIRDSMAATSSKINRDVDETETQRDLRLMFKDAYEAMGLVRDVRKTQSSEENIRKLKAMELSIAKKAVKSFNASDTNRKQFKKWEAQAETYQKD